MVAMPVIAALGGLGNEDCSKLGANLGYMRICLNNKTNSKINKDI